MASLTIRKLDDAIKSYLRLRSAKNGRSVEEEVRVILGELIQGRPELPVRASPASTEASMPAPQPIGTTIGQASVTLIIGGGIAAFKSLELIRRLKERHIDVRCVLTKAAQQFVTPLSASALSHERVYTDLFDPGSEFDAGHIRLARECDLIVVAPATADLMAKMAQGHADDLASAILLAADRPILLAPAMNPLMWNNAATRRNVMQLRRDGVHMIGPNAGEMAESNEAGVGRMSEAIEIAAAAVDILRPPRPRPLAGKRVLITAGPRALYRQPFVRQAGFCHRRRGAVGGRRCHARLRPGRTARSCGRDGDPCGIGARHAASGTSCLAGRYRDLRRRRGRLARCQ
jgi:phosphopantothenoylcysteine decarboxylase/phosphopantothenate--cysteine ligase